MTVQVQREFPFDLKKKIGQLRQELSYNNLANLPPDEVGTCLMFLDGSKRESNFSFITFDIFGSTQPKGIDLCNMSFSSWKRHSFLETIEILSDRKLMRDIKQGLKETEEGKLISERDFLKKHKLK